MSRPGTVAAVNRALRALGVDARLRRGRGYYYFDGPATAWKGGSSVAVARAEQLTVAEWLAEYERMRQAAQLATVVPGAAPALGMCWYCGQVGPLDVPCPRCVATGEQLTREDWHGGGQ